MLVMNSKFYNLPVASIQAGHKVASVSDMIIDPDRLRVIAFYVESTESAEEKVLYCEDVVEITVRGLVINHDQQIMDNDEDLVRLQKFIKQDFQLINKPVESESGAKLGKVNSFAINTSSYNIAQLYVLQPLNLNFTKAQVIIHRNQIVNVTKNKIIVKDSSVKVGARFGFKGLLFGRQPTVKPDTKTANRK